MPELLLYLLKANIAFVLFYLAYRFALRRLTFYTLNRFFLVSGIIFSSLYPFVDLTELFKNNQNLDNSRIVNIVRELSPIQQVSEQLSTKPAQISLPVKTQISEKVSFVPEIDYRTLIAVIFWTGVILMIIRMAVQLLSLYRIHKSSKAELFNTYIFRRINGKVNPFSFWQSIYLNPDQHSPDELNSILEHEQVHIKELHSLDILLAEISTIFYWFNPVVWLMKQGVRENLEFIADHKVLHNGLDKKTYQYSLAHISSLPQSFAIVNNFNFLGLKKRILMMNKKKSSKAQVLRYLFLLPIIAFLSLSFIIPIAKLKNAGISMFTKKSVTADGIVSEATKLLSQESEKVEDLQNEKAKLLYIVDGIPLMGTIRVNGIAINSFGNVVSNDPSNIINLTSISDAAKIAVYTKMPAYEAIIITTKPGIAKKTKIVNSGSFNSDPQNPDQTIITGQVIRYSLFVVDGVPIKAVDDGKDEISISPRFLSLPVNANGVTILSSGSLGSYSISFTASSGNGPNIIISASSDMTYALENASYNNNIETTITNLIPGKVIKGGVIRQETISDGYITRIYPEHYVTKVRYITTKAAEEKLALISKEKADLVPFRLETQELAVDNKGVYEKLLIKNLEKFESNKIWVFNGVGQKVFEKTNYKNDWTGKDMSNNDLPAGKYFIVLNLEDGKKVSFGNVTLVR